MIKYRDLSNYVLLNKLEEPITVDMGNLIAFSESAFRDFKKVLNESDISIETQEDFVAFVKSSFIDWLAAKEE